jgi:hypothetical protein
MEAEPPKHRQPSSTALLFLALVLYATANLITVYLAGIGALGPSLPLLGFLTFMLPALASALVLAIQLAFKPRPFHPLAVVVFLLAMALAAYLNFQALWAASAAA